MSKSIASVVFVRHGESQGNAKNVYTGWDDTPLSIKGEQEAEEAGLCLKAKGLKFDIVFTSALQRLGFGSEFLKEFMALWLVFSLLPSPSCFCPSDITVDCIVADVFLVHDMSFSCFTSTCNFLCQTSATSFVPQARHEDRGAGPESVWKQLSARGQELEAQCTPLRWFARIDAGRCGGTVRRGKGDYLEKCLGFMKRDLRDLALHYSTRIFTTEVPEVLWPSILACPSIHYWFVDVATTTSPNTHCQTNTPRTRPLHGVEDVGRRTRRPLRTRRTRCGAC